MCIVKYKGFKGKYSLDDEKKILSGIVLKMDEHINFSGESISEVEKNFQNKIDIYIESKQGVECNDKFLDGKIRINIDPETHKAFHQIAMIKGTVANDLIKDFIEETVGNFYKV